MAVKDIQERKGKIRAAENVHVVPGLVDQLKGVGKIRIVPSPGQIIGLQLPERRLHICG